MWQLGTLIANDRVVTGGYAHGGNRFDFPGIAVCSARATAAGPPICSSVQAESSQKNDCGANELRSCWHDCVELAWRRVSRTAVRRVSSPKPCGSGAGLPG